MFQLGSKAICNHAAGLPNFELCRKNPNVLISIGKGTKLGIEECQQQMKNERWNCSTVPRDFSVFGKVLKIGNKHIRDWFERELVHGRVNKIFACDGEAESHRT